MRLLMRDDVHPDFSCRRSASCFPVCLGRINIGRRKPLTGQSTRAASQSLGASTGDGVKYSPTTPYHGFVRE